MKLLLTACLLAVSYAQTDPNNQCDTNQLDACESFPCIDLREGADHHHMMSLTAVGQASVRYFNRDWRHQPANVWQCTCSSCTAESLVGTWHCPNFYGTVITITSDYADDFTPERINDSIEFCGKPYEEAFSGGCVGGTEVSTTSSITTLSGCYKHAKANGYAYFSYYEFVWLWPVYSCTLYDGSCTSGDSSWSTTYRMTQDCDVLFDDNSAEGREQYAAYCVPSTYRAIPCPVLRGLMGSGFLEWGNVNGGATPEDILEDIENTLGVTGSLLDVFDFVNDIAVNGFVDILNVATLTGFNHGASTGIIGANTGGALADHPEFNLYQFEKMLSCSENGVSFTLEEWGACVNMFAGDRYAQNFWGTDHQADVAWATNPFSWITLTGEFTLVFNAFKGDDDLLPVSAVTSLWRDATLPQGWESAQRQITQTLHDDTARSMGIEIVQGARDEMTNADPVLFEAFYNPAVAVCGPSPWVDCQKSVSGYHLAPPGAATCDYGETVSSDDCERVGAMLATGTAGRSLQSGSGGTCNDGGWGNVPPGCSIQSGGDNAAHYQFVDNQCSSYHAAYQLVCWTKTYHLAPPGAGTCDYGETVSYDDCEVVSATLVTGAIGRPLQYGGGGSCNDGGWGNVPPGCSAQVGGDNAAHYQTIDHECNTYHAAYQLVCWSSFPPKSSSCDRPLTWCTHSGAHYEFKDCDGDGIPDPVCSDANGHYGVLQSSNSCHDSWPHGSCSNTGRRKLNNLPGAESLMFESLGNTTSPNIVFYSCAMIGLLAVIYHTFQWLRRSKNDYEDNYVQEV